MISDWITALSSSCTAIGVALAAFQLRQSKRQARTDFEDHLASQFREIALALPIEALFGEKLSDDDHKKYLEHFYHYFDLTNEQVFLHETKRISPSTWQNWCDGIRTNMQRPAFSRAWEEIKLRSEKDFEELRRLEKNGFKYR